MAATGEIFTFFQPLQIFATLAAAVNTGGSVLQSPLIMPMLQMPSVPIQHASAQTAYLLHNSEKFFPPLNAASTLSNLVLTTLAYLNSPASDSLLATPAQRLYAAKLPRLGLATALNFATTAWALLIMVPRNKKMAKLAEELGRAEGKPGRHAQAEREFRALQRSWQRLNYGRAAIMIASSIVGMMAILKV